MTDSLTLLGEYARTGSESAFRELVSRHVNLVYSTALRVVGGDSHLAEDVAQTVFLALARGARSLPRGVVLGGWLHRHTCYLASKAVRAEVRRKARERQAVEMNALDDDSNGIVDRIAPMLDQAVCRLGGKDRIAIVLRFYEQRDFRSIGEALGTTDDAARMRVNRALERLHSILARRGVTFSVAALESTLAAEAVSAAPACLAAGIASAAVAGAAAGGGEAFTVISFMTMTKMKLALAGIVIGAAASLHLVVDHRSQAVMRKENESLRSRVEAMEQEAAVARPQAQVEPAIAREQLSELLRLRAQVTALRDQLAQVTNRVPGTTPSPPSGQSAEDADKALEGEQQEMIARVAFTKEWMVALRLYAKENQGQCPSNFDQAAAYLGNEAKAQTNLSTDQFEIVYQGSLNDLTNESAANTIVMRERELRRTHDGRWGRVYGMADGSCQQRFMYSKSNLEQWEHERLRTPTAP